MNHRKNLIMNSIQLVISLILITSCHPKKDTIVDKEKIVGRWILVNAHYSQIEFTKTEQFDYAQGNLMASFNYEIDDNNILTAVNKKDHQDIYKYRITKLTDDSLIWKYVPTNYEMKYFRKK